MRRANSAIERERHPIPTIEEVLYDLNDSTVFSKLKLSGASTRWNLMKDRERSQRLLHTLVCKGTKGLMFGVTSAPEKYQKIVVLTQLQDGEWRAISYASRNLTEVERRYSQTEKEALALV